MVLVGGCTETVVRCREGYLADDGMEGRTRCVLADGGSDGGSDAMVRIDACDPAAADLPGDGIDSNCDGVDGVRGDTLFVATSGDDMNSGLTPEQPVRTVSKALSIARAGTRRSILIAVGSYDAVPIALGDSGAEVATHQLVDGVTLSGRYPGGSGGWVARSSAMDDRSLLRGTITAAFILDLRSAVTFHDVDLTSELDGMLYNLSCFGVLVVGSGVVTLDRSRVQVCAGSSAPKELPDAGRTRGGGSNGAAGGVGGFGCSGDGNGGQGGTDGSVNGANGAVGTMTALGAAAAGGDGGTMAQPSGGTGATGAEGQRGLAVTMGEFSEEGYLIPQGERAGTGGTGGGGGGGGYGTMMGASGVGGGGGGGGCGGEGGLPGVSGGASIGVFAWGDSIRVILPGTTITTAGGGDGGPGGAGGGGGPGGAGGESVSGGRGGNGGSGGRGGEGAPGAGGPSFGVVARSLDARDFETETWRIGYGGRSGASLGGRGLQQHLFRLTRP